MHLRASRPGPGFHASILASVLALTACGEPAKPAVTPAPPAPPVAAAPPPVADAGPAVTALPAGVPDTVAGHQLAWVLASFAQTPSEADVTLHFAPSFLAEVSPAKVAQIFGHLGPELAPMIVDRIDPGATADTIAAVLHSGRDGAPEGAKLKVSLHVEGAAPFRMEALLLRPMMDAKLAASWDEVQTGLHAVAPQVGFLAANMDAGKCVPLSSIDPKKPLALGSAFKLYVLYALAKQIAAGKHAWTDTIAIEDAKKSLPSGDMRNAPAGTTFTVREMAEKMISVSDNTATDHLLAFLGPKVVEEAVKTSGHATPARLVPFLSTRQLFALKMLGTDDELKAYVHADVAHKRAMLDVVAKRDLAQEPVEGGGWNKPRNIDTIEWVASPDDLCKLMVGLKQLADAPATAPVGAILAINPGIPDDRGSFQYVGFKGGSEPGVMNMTWLLQKKGEPATSGKWSFVTVGFNDPSTVIDEARAVPAAAAARDFLGK